MTNPKTLQEWAICHCRPRDPTMLTTFVFAKDEAAAVAEVKRRFRGLAIIRSTHRMRPGAGHTAGTGSK